jgi:hypothetical protein
MMMDHRVERCGRGPTGPWAVDIVAGGHDVSWSPWRSSALLHGGNGLHPPRTHRRRYRLIGLGPWEHNLCLGEVIHINGVTWNPASIMNVHSPRSQPTKDINVAASRVRQPRLRFQELRVWVVRVGFARTGEADFFPILADGRSGAPP